MTPIKPELPADDCICECDGTRPHAVWCPESLSYPAPVSRFKNRLKAPKMKDNGVIHVLIKGKQK